MKILAVSILRLGDVFMAAPTLMGLRRKYPDAEIDLLVNSECLKVRNFLPMINEVYGFDRNCLQDALVQPASPVLAAYDYLRDFVLKMNQNNYDMVINLTQNKASGYLCDLIHAKDKQGLVLSPNQQVQFGSQWFRFLNDISAAGARSVFHYTDIFSRATGVAASRFTYPVIAQGDAELKQNVKLGNGRKIVFQVKTSDVKKDLSLRLINETVGSLVKSMPTANIIFLCAPNEKEDLANTIQSIAKSEDQIQLAALSLEGALALLQACDLLITTDTSIKHLACGTGIKVIEVAAGSADPRRTGAYTEKALIVQSRESCVPCSHSSACHRERRFCEESISGYFLAALAYAFLANDNKTITLLSEEYSDQVEIFKTRFAPQGYWCAEALRETAQPRVMEDWLDLAAWRFLLDRDHLNRLAPYGTEGMQILGLLKDKHREVASATLKSTLEHIEQRTATNADKINRLQHEFAKQIRDNMTSSSIEPSMNDFLSDLRNIEQELDLGDALSARAINKDSVGMHKVRTIQSALNDISNHQQIKLKIIRTIKTQISETK